MYLYFFLSSCFYRLIEINEFKPGTGVTKITGLHFSCGRREIVLSLYLIFFRKLPLFPTLLSVFSPSPRSGDVVWRPPPPVWLVGCHLDASDTSCLSLPILVGVFKQPRASPQPPPLKSIIYGPVQSFGDQTVKAFHFQSHMNSKARLHASGCSVAVQTHTAESQIHWKCRLRLQRRAASSLFLVAGGEHSSF